MDKITHNERCKKCKPAIKELLIALFNNAEQNYDLDLPCRIEDYNNNIYSETLKTIYVALQKYRGFDNFVRAKRLSKVDYFVPSENIIVEFDESQHFTKPREIALSHYSHKQQWGFPLEKWRKLCIDLNKRDNDPPYRDEQRAWYDSLRDFAPKLRRSCQTIRLYSRDLIWCSLNPNNSSDLATFKKILKKAKKAHYD